MVAHSTDGFGEVERDQQQLRDNIAASDRLIVEAQQRMAASRAFTRTHRTDDAAKRRN